MISRATIIASAAAGLSAALLYGYAAKSTEPATNLGTLTCTASPDDKDLLGAEQRVSCVFEPLTGSKASLDGTIKRIGGQSPVEAKVVLVWAVLGPSVDAAAKQLEGRYIGSPAEGRGTGDGRETNVGGLVGGNGGHFALRPLALDSSLGENAAIAVLELQLSSIKA